MVTRPGSAASLPPHRDPFDHRGEMGFLWFLFLLGSIPLVGVLVLGYWDRIDLGIATLMVTIVGRELTLEYWERAKRRRR